MEKVFSTTRIADVKQSNLFFNLTIRKVLYSELTLIFKSTTFLKDFERRYFLEEKKQKRVIKQHTSNRERDIVPDASTEKHDKFTFETKLDYGINKDLPKTNYFLSCYFFIPESLQINEMTYPREKFYSDLNNHIRFKTPMMSVYGIISENNEHSPINIIEKLLEQIKCGDTNVNFDEITTQLRLLGSIMKSSIRDQIKYFMNESKKGCNCEDLNEEFLRYLSDLEILQKKLRKLSKEFLMVQIPDEIRESFKFADEYISLRVQNNLMNALNSLPKDEVFKTLREKLISVIEAEFKHRKDVGSRLIRKRDSDNADFIYYESILKKYLQGVLYLKIKNKNEASKALQLFYSVAAGIAMFVSLMVGLLVANQFEENSLPFILALVVAYMFKDRIKENIKSLSNRVVRILLPDNKKEIWDTHEEKKIGIVSETMRFLKMSDVPPEILNIRQFTNLSPIEQQGKPEIVIHYLKHTTLENSHISEYENKLFTNIIDIIRFNIRNLTQYADDSVKIEKVWNLETKQIDEIPCSKVYHINMILKLYLRNKDQQDIVHYKKVRVIIDQDGIKSVQNMPTHI